MTYMKSPAFQFYAAEWISDEHVSVMTLEEEGAYIRSLSYCWREGSIPADLDALSRLCKNASRDVLTVVTARFTLHPTLSSRLIHPRLEAEREKQRAWRSKSAQGGKASAGKRKHPRHLTPEQGGAQMVEPNGNRTVDQWYQPKVNSSSSSSSKRKSAATSAASRDPLLEHEAVRLYREICRITPNQIQRRVIAEQVTDLDRYRTVLTGFMEEGQPPNHVDWTLERYENGERPRALSKAEMNRAGTGKVVL